MKRILLVKFVILFVFSLPVYVMGQGTELFTVKVQQDGNTIGSNGSIYLLDKDNFSLKLTSRNDSCLKLKTELNGIIATSETEVTLNHEESGNLYFELRGNGKATITVTPYFCKRENKPGESFSITFGKKASSVKTATESSTSTVIPAPNPKSQPTPTKTTQTSAKTPEGENPEEKAKKAWDKLTASKQNSYCDYQNFINSYPNSKNKVDAENKIAGIKSDTIRYSCALDPKEKRVDFTLNAVMAPHISSISGALRENIDSSQLNCGRFSIRGATSMENLIIEIYDSLKTNGVRYRKIDLDVSKAIQVSIDTGRTGIIFISVIRGIKPYTLSVDTFRRDFQDTISISIEELQNKNIVGTVHFQVYDSQDAGRAFDKEIPKKPWFKWYYIAIPILIFLMGLLYLLKKKKEKERAKHKKEEWDKKKEEQKLPLLINTLSEDTQKDEHSPIQPIDDPNKQGMIIKPRIRAEKSIMVLDDDEKLPFSTTDYLEIPVHNTWDDSCVQAIYMNSPSISKLDSFLRTQSSAFIEEQDMQQQKDGGGCLVLVTVCTSVFKCMVKRMLFAI